MSTFGVASRGAGWMIGVQLIVGLGQFLYSSLTARLFTPTEFGGFTAALSLQGLLILLTTTGLPSIILKERTLSAWGVRSVRTYAILGAALASVVFWYLSPYWLALLNAESGMLYVPFLTVAILIGPIATIESALLRREGRSPADAITLLISFVGSTTISVIVALATGEAWALALATATNAAILGVSAAIARRDRYVGGARQRHRDLLSFASGVSAQNVVFLLIGQAPFWAVSASLGASSLGNYSRASTLAGIPSTSLSTALSRAVQPHWRTLSDLETTGRAIRDTALLTSSLAFPMFAILAAVGSDLTFIWLGPGWGLAGELVPWLAVAFGFQMPFTILAGSLEMRGMLRPIRVAQVGLALALLVGISLFLATGDAIVAAAAAAASQAAGLLTLAVAIARPSGLRPSSLLSRIGVAAAWGVAIGLSAHLGATVSRNIGWSILGSAEAASVLFGGFLAILIWITTFRWQPALKTLRLRGVRVPRFLGRA